MQVREMELPGVCLLTPVRYEDERGYFMELWQQARYDKLGIPERFVQDNCSFSCRGVLRGLHFQNPAPQGKLVSVLQGTVFDVVVDLRREAPTFGQWEGVELSEENRRQLYIPEGFAHGFVATSEEALVHYKTTAYYAPEHDQSLRWDDPEIDIDWPVEEPILSEKDASAPLLSELPESALF